MILDLHNPPIDIPEEVLYVKIATMCSIPIGGSVYSRIITKYPECFPEETEHRRKCEAIPQKVHDDYNKEFWELREYVYKDSLPGLGMGYWSKHPEEYEKFRESRKIPDKIMKEKEKELHKKYYSKYGI